MEIDSLEVSIQGKAESAENAIERLVSKLNDIPKALNKIATIPIKFDFEMKNLSSLQSTAQKSLENIGGEIDKIGERLAKSFHIDSKKTSSNLSKQLHDIMQDLADSYNGKFDFGSYIDYAMQNLIESIVQNGKIAKGELEGTLWGIEEEYRDFYDYFNKHKIYISDFLKYDIGKTEFSSLLQTNLSNIVREAEKGININANWEELLGSFPSILPKRIDNAADQVITVLQKIRDIREEIKPISIQSLIGREDYHSAIEKINEEAFDSFHDAASKLLKEIRKIESETSDAFTPTININEEGIVSQIQSAIRKAAKAEYEPLKVNLRVDTEKINKQLKDALSEIDISKLSNDLSSLGNITFNTAGLAEFIKSVLKFGNKSFTNAVTEMGKAKDGIVSFLKDVNGTGGLQFDPTKLAILISSITNLGKKSFAESIKVIKESGKDIVSFTKDVSRISGFSFDATKLETLIKSISKLGNKSFASAAKMLKNSGNDIVSFAKQISEIKDFSFDTTNLTALIKSVSKLGNKSARNAAKNLQPIATGLQDFVRNMNKIGTVSFDTQSLANLISSVSKLGSKMSKAASVNLTPISDQLQNLIKKLNKIGSLSFDMTNLTELISAISRLGREGAKNAITNIPLLETALMNLFNTLSDAPNISQNTIDMTEALAKLASTGGKAGSAAKSLGNVFDASSSSAGMLSSSIKKLSKSINGLGTGIKKTFGKLKSFSTELLQSFGLIGGAYGIINGAMKSINIASQLTEIQNVVNTVFGNMSYKIEEFAKTSIEQFGMSELSLKQYASRFQAMGTAIGISPSLIGQANSNLSGLTNGYVSVSNSMSNVSMNLTKLVADMASFYDVSQADVAEDLYSVFTGMVEPLRIYGLDLTEATLKEWAMKQGLDANIQSMSQAEKTMLRYQYVMSQSVAAHNDFAKTADSWSNSVRILKQNFEQLGSIIGGSLINAFKPFLRALNVALQHVISFAKTVTEALGAIFGWKYEISSGGVVGDWSSIEDSTGGIADNLGDASKSVEKINKQIRGWDELNVITSQEPSNGGSGGSGAGLGDVGASGSIGKLVPAETIFKDYESMIDNLYDLGDYIGKKLKDALGNIKWNNIYEKAKGFGKGLADFLNGLISPALFSNLGSTIAGAINTALHFLDSFGKTFEWSEFGYSIGSGLNSFMETLDWETALSAAKNWGTGIATALNSFLKGTDFYLVGETIANFVNTAVEFVFSAGKTFDFELAGNKIATAITGFFKTIDAKKLGESISVWIRGGLKTVTTILKKSDFDLIGKKIGKFLVGLDFGGLVRDFANALLKFIQAAFKTLGGMIKEAPLETILIAAFALFKFTGVGKVIAAAISASFATALGGSLGVSLTGQVPTVQAVVTTALSKAIETPVGNVVGAIGKIGAAVPIAAASFFEFNLASGALEGIVTKTDSLLVSIGKIAGVIGTAVLAFAAFGPVGAVAVGVAGVLGGIKGISDAFQQIRTEDAENAIRNALTKPGGTDVEEIFTNFNDGMEEIGNSFSLISEKSAGLEPAKKNIGDTIFEIDKIKTSLDAGVMTAEEAVPILTELYDQLGNAITTKIGVAGNTLLAAFAEGGVVAQAFEYSGMKANETRERIVTSMDEQEKAVYALVEELNTLRETDPTNPKIPELEAQLYAAAGGMKEVDKEMEKLRIASSTGLNWSEYINEKDFGLSKISSDLGGMTDSAIRAREAWKENLEQMALDAKELGDEETYNKIMEAMPKAIEYGNKLIAQEILKRTTSLQEGLVNETKRIVEEAQKEWENMSPEEKIKSAFENEDELVRSRLKAFNDNVVVPYSAEMKTALESLGLEGAVFASDAMEEIMNGMWVENPETHITEMTNNVSGVVRKSLNEAKRDIEPYAKDLGENIVKGVMKPMEYPDVSDPNVKFRDKFLEGFEDCWEIHSPSKVMEREGVYLTQGIFDGINSLVSSVIQIFTNIQESILGVWNTAKEKTEEVWNTISGKVEGTWNDLKTWAYEKFNSAKESIGNAWDTVKTKTDTIWNEASKKVEDTWNTIKGWATDKFGNIKKSITDAWNEVKTNTESTWNKLKDIIKSPINAILGFINKLLNGVEVMQNGIANAFNKINVDVPDWLSTITGIKSIGFHVPMWSAPQIQLLKTGGYVVNSMPRSYSLFSAGEDGIPELLGTVGGRTAVAGGEEITGIKEAINLASREEMYLLRSILQELKSKEMSISSGEVFKSVQKEARDYQARTYRPAF